MHPRTRHHVPADARAALVGQVDSSFGGTVRLPGSKSLTNRYLLLAALASGTSRLANVLDCDDSRYLLDALSQLGLEVDVEEDGAAEKVGGVHATVPGPLAVRIRGAGGAFPEKRGEFSLGNAGTTTRFLTAALAASEGSYVVDGDERLRQRPIEDLVRALNDLGANVQSTGGCPPVTIHPARLEGGGIDMSGSTSSQFVSAVLMTSPLALGPVSVRLVGATISKPYIDLTVQAMRDFSGSIKVYEKTDDGQPVFRVDRGRAYRARSCAVEGDASSAGYFYAAAAITGATVRVEGVGRGSSQGDLRCADVLAQMGCRVNKEEDVVTVTGGILHGVDCDCGDIPDAVPTLAVASLFARGKTRLRGVPHLRHKESDRIATVASELRKLGAEVKERLGGLEIHGTPGTQTTRLHGAEIDTWGDHRIAMALSVAGLMLPGMVIRDPGVVSKSYPGFFHALATLGAPVSFALAGGGRSDVVVEGGGDS